MNCEQARETLLDSLVGSIAAEVHLLMEDHIASCDALPTVRRRSTKPRCSPYGGLPCGVPEPWIPKFSSNEAQRCRVNLA